MSLVDGDRLIRVMPDALANKIAAGEVVQRPASALKELVENSLDAGAERIDVRLKGAGSLLVQVTDDGAGMSRSDATEAFRRHATSKLYAIEDLDALMTLGFRGEALASIASVAQVELRTRRATDEAGTKVLAEGGAVRAAEPVGTPIGTSLSVRNLFYNVPARRAFLKSAATEYRHLLETFQALALSHPEVAFTLHHDDDEVYRLRPLDGAAPDEALRHRIGELFDRALGEALVSVEETTTYLRVKGFVGRPDRHKRTRSEQFLYVNQRHVRSRALEHAVASAFEHLIPEGTHPFFALFLEIDPAHVDVNVHPSKAEVKFDDERGVYGFLRAVVRKALAQADFVPELPPDPLAATFGAAPLAPQPAGAFDPSVEFTLGPGGTVGATFEATFGAGPFEAGTLDADATARPHGLGDGETVGTVAAGTLAAGAFAAPVQGSLDGLVPQGEDAGTGEGIGPEALLFQLHDTYILTPIRSGLLVLDQRAAHERILYEKALATLHSGFGLSQQLLFPHTFDASAPDLALLKELQGDLVALGFVVEFFSGRTVVVRGVPADVRAGDERSILEDLIEQFRGLRERLRLPHRETLARAIARRSALRHGQRLAQPEMRILIDQLFACEVPFAAPDGRPTLTRLTTDELARRFG